MRRYRRFVPLIVLALVVGSALMVPLGVIASHQFIDVPTSSTFHADIDAIRDAGVTTGCAPGKYCPKDFVTREQMAAFLNRLGALGAGKPPVVNAATLNGNPSYAFLPAGGLTVMHQIGPWVSVGQPQVVVTNTWDTVVFAPEDALLWLDLRQPPGFSGWTFRLSRVEICFDTGMDSVTINGMAVGQTAGNPYVPLEEVGSLQVPGGECATLSVSPDATQISAAYYVWMELAGGPGVEVRIGDVKSLWGFTGFDG